MKDGDGKYDITRQLIYDLRKRLLDTKTNNPLISFHFSERSRTHIRVINELPDVLYSKLMGRKTLTFASLSQIQQIPSDEQTDAFRMGLQAARLSGTDYRHKTNELDAKNNQNGTGEQQLEQELRDKVRRQLGLPPRSKKELPSLVECAKQMGINPSFELPLPDEKSDDSTGDSGHTIQTLLFSDQMERKLSGLYNQIRISLSEMGVNTLYCAWGFLEWFESDDSDIPLFAPLVLLPLQMKQTLVRQTYRYSVESTGDDAEINLTLRERLRQDFAMELPLFEEIDTPESYFAKISEMIEEKNRWRVRRFVTIGKLSFSRLVMYQDLDPSRWPANRPLERHRVLSDLLGGMEHDGTTTAEEYLVDDKDVSAAVPILITNADSSQFSAIVDAMKGKNLVIQGPPGTGKSQTITNIIAVALYLRKKVLFLSEKVAALEVVKKRLDEAGIGDFCLELHSTKAQKQQVLDSLKKRRSIQPASPVYDLPIKEEREKLQDQLNEYSIRLNQLWGKTGKTINEIIWSEQRTRETVAGYKAPDSLGLLEERSANNMTLVNLDERLSKLRIVEEAYCLITGKYGSLAKHPWYGINGAMMSVFDQESTVLDLSRWLSKINQITEAAFRISRLLETAENDLTIDSVTDFLAAIRESVCVGQLEIESSIVSNLRDQQTVEAVDRLISDCHDYGAKYNELRNCVANPEKILGREIPQAGRLVDLVSKLPLQETIDSLRIPEIKTLSDNLKLTSFKLRECSFLANEWRQLLGYTDSLTAAGIQNVLSAIQLQISTPREVIIRRKKELTDELNADVLERGRTLACRIIAKQTELEKRFTINLGDTPERLRQLSYTIREAGLLRRFGRSYRNAMKAYLLLFRPDAPKPKPAQMASDLLAIANLLEEIQRLNDDTQVRRVVGLDFRGTATDFAMLLAVNEYGASVSRCFNINTQLGKRIRQFLLEEPTEVLDAVQAVAKGLDIDEFKYYVDAHVSRDPNKDIDCICREYDEAAAEADTLYTNLSAMTVKEHVSIQETTNLARTIQELDRINLSISENAVAKLALGDHFKGPNSGTELICSANSRAKSILSAKLPGACISKLLSNEHNLICLELSSIAKELESLLSQETEIRNSVLSTKKVDLCLFLEDARVENVAIASILERLHRSVDNPKAFSAWASYCQVRQEAIELGLGQIVDMYLQPKELSAPLHLADAYEWVFYRSLVKSFFADFPQFRRFSGLNHESLRQRYAKLDRETILLQRRMLARQLAANPIKPGVGSGPRSGWTNLSLLENEIGKKKRHIALRDLLMRSSDAILAMKPCFMMSPASVAQFIRPDSSTEFDIVIIDEASQMKPEEALGAIARGKQLIVVGDPKQLPPTSFFDRTDFPDDEEETNTEDYIDTESILDLSLSTFRPSRSLNWHYRSRHESLIAFSNKSFYKDSPLTVFPSSKAKHQDLGIEYRFVNGVYRGRTNIAEAQEVIAIAREYMYKYPDRSLGIATMNIPQMEILNAELELLFSRDRRCYEYRVRWASTLEPLFAKNLENVQGDERDVIFISTLYGPNETGKVMQRFGPVNSSAGLRRLNVLFTRAKEKIVVFSSMKSTDIIPTEASQEGVGVLKAYLEYARTGQLESGKESGREPDSDFEIFVGEKLRRCGYEVVPQVGVSGYFIDLAVKNPNDLDSYVLGIECDGRTHHSAKSARDRDRLRQEVLEAMGWRIHRIWSLDWFQDSEGQMKRLLDCLKGLCAVTSPVTSQDHDDSEDVKTEEYQKTQMQELKDNSVATQPESDDEDTSEIPTPTPDTSQISVLNTVKSLQRVEVNECRQPIRLVKEETSMEFLLKKDKETPGTWRFKENKDERPLTIYLTKEQVSELGNPTSIVITITAA